MLLWVGMILLVVGLMAFIYGCLVVRINYLQLEPRDNTPEIAVLIPARDESAVIAGLLGSLQKQKIDGYQAVKMSDVYVIVENEDDPTVNICREFGASLVVRKCPITKSRRCKGFALDEAVKHILAERKHYDLYFVFDADNVVAPKYFERMLESYDKGYQMATGYRAPRNANDNVIAAASSLTFSMINTMGNRRRAKYGANMIFSGTGFYVDGKIVEKWHGWPFRSLTEDYEMSLYAILHSLTTTYNTKAVFYDEQPTKYRQTVAQRVRWIRGYFEARKKYVPLLERVKRARNVGSVRKECLGVRPIILMLIGVIIILLDGIVMAMSRASVNWLWLAGGVVVVVYVALMLVTIILLVQEKLKLRKGLLIAVVLYNPLYLVTYVACAVRALMRKEVKWQRIEHKGNSSSKM